MKQVNHNLTMSTLSRSGLTSEINDLIRSRTELECVLEDLRIASERAGGKREELEAALAEVDDEIQEKEQSLEKLAPKWDTHRAKEAEERRWYVCHSSWFLDHFLIHHHQSG